MTNSPTLTLLLSISSSNNLEISEVASEGILEKISDKHARGVSLKELSEISQEKCFKEILVQFLRI